MKQQTFFILRQSYAQRPQEGHVKGCDWPDLGLAPALSHHASPLSSL